MSRLDQALVERGFCESREKARRAILAGQVRVNQQVGRKASDAVKPGDELVLAAPERFVSRGGYKLQHALDTFKLAVTGVVAIDLGASTGGFTDCLLQAGAAKVYAVDVGRGQLAWKLRQDSRVVVMEGLNARQADAAHFPAPFSPVALIVIDCSFISLRKIIPPAAALLAPGGRIVALIKPQFEAGKAEADKGAGVIKDPKIHQRVISELEQFVEGATALTWRPPVESPLLGPAGNKEFLVLLEKNLDPIRRAALVANPAKPSVRTLVRQAVRLLRQAGVEILSDESTASLAGLPAGGALPAAQLARAADLMLVFGGDGTMLRAVREAEGARTPILGLNAGHLGFLTAVSSKDLKPALLKVLAGHYFVEARSLIRASGRASGREINFHALNDIVISRGSASRMIELDVEVNGSLLTRYRCDGLIISSPTGSTAYSLSAGGAIISPSARVFSITPICPHTLSNRSVIVGMDSVIQVRVASEKVETSVTADGQINALLDSGDTITIRRARRDVRLVHLDGSTFFETVRRKLHWSGSNV